MSQGPQSTYNCIGLNSTKLQQDISEMTRSDASSPDSTRTPAKIPDLNQ